MAQFTLRPRWMTVAAGLALGSSLIVAQARGAGPKPADAKPAEVKTTDAKAGDAKSKDAKAGDAKSADAKTGDAKSTGDAKPAAAGVSAKLTKPWSEITSLSEEQRQKIHDIHVKVLAQVSEIEKQEKADIMALLTDAQKNELKEAAAKDRKEAADRRGAKKTDAPTAPPK